MTMSKPLKIVRSLDTLTTGYTIFEKDQVLTEKQLNGITDYLIDQGRMTRIQLLGTGIIGGLDVKLDVNKVIISRGVGVTTDGDLLVLPTDSTFDKFKNYDEKAPFYPPFYSGSAGNLKMMSVFELVRAEEKDPIALNLTRLPVSLGDMVVIMYMESYHNDPDLCSGTDCDNLGQEVINTVRFLLVARSDAASLLNALTSNSEISLGLPEIMANRPLIAGAISTTGALAKLYRDACDSTHKGLTKNLRLLFKILPGLIQAPFNADPSPGWIATLNTLHTRFAQQDIAIQYYYDFLKDLVETWNALREVLFDDDSVLCPDINAFPKHLLLGSFGYPAEMRTSLYPSPLNGKVVHEHAHFLALKLHTLINNFAAPKDSVIIVTPSHDESVTLEQRAIPYYYAYNDSLPIHLGWNYRLKRRGAATRNPGYRMPTYGDTTNNPLLSQIGRNNFFRIEGHIGQNVSAASKEIEQLIRAYNLPFALQSVLLHNDRTRITIRPPFRQTPLHKLHYLLRKDVATQLEDGKTFNLSFKDNIHGAVTRQEIPATLSSGTDAKATTLAAQEHYEKVDAAIVKASAPLTATRYSTYRQSLTATSGNWKSAYKDTLDAAGTFKINFGAMVRTEFATPFDSLMTSNHSLWLDWLDTLIDHNDAREDDKLLFSNFITRHPGLEHFGGVSRGGTFILVYDDKANVVADFMIPCCTSEIDEVEPEEPVLSQPPYKPTLAIDKGFTLLQPLSAMFVKQLGDFKLQIQPEWQNEINIQKEHMAFFKESVGALTELAGSNTRVKVDNIAVDFTDKMLEYHVNEVKVKSKQVTDLQEIVMDQQQPAEVRDQASKKLQTVQDSLAESISEGTKYVVTSKTNMSTSSDGSKAMNYLSQGMSMVTEGATRNQLGNRLNEIRGAASGEQAAAIDGLIKVGGFAH